MHAQNATALAGGRAWRERGSLAQRTCQNEGAHYHPVVRAWLTTGAALQNRSFMRAVATQQAVMLKGEK